MPYYSVLSEEKDLTTAPLIFDNETKMLQMNSDQLEKNIVLRKFWSTRKYKSSLLNKNKNISYLFSNLEYDLDFSNFNTSKFYFNIEKVTDDTFLKFLIPI